MNGFLHSFVAQQEKEKFLCVPFHLAQDMLCVLARCLFRFRYFELQILPWLDLENFP